MTDSL